jgi:hypothetical protein
VNDELAAMRDLLAELPDHYPGRRALELVYAMLRGMEYRMQNLESIVRDRHTPKLDG